MANTNEIINILKNADPRSLVDMCKEDHRYGQVCIDNKAEIFKHVLNKYNVDYKDPKSLIYYISGSENNTRYHDINDFKHSNGTYKFGDIFNKYFEWYNKRDYKLVKTTVTNIPSLPKIKKLLLIDNLSIKKIEGDFLELTHLDIKNNTNVEFIRGNFPELRTLIIQQTKIKEIQQLSLSLPSLENIIILDNSLIETIDVSLSKYLRFIRVLRNNNLSRIVLPNVNLHDDSVIDTGSVFTYMPNQGSSYIRDDFRDQLPDDYDGEDESEYERSDYDDDERSNYDDDERGDYDDYDDDERSDYNNIRSFTTNMPNRNVSYEHYRNNERNNERSANT